MKNETNQANDQTVGHVASNANDPFAGSIPEGDSIGRETNFGIKHHGFVNTQDNGPTTK